MKSGVDCIGVGMAFACHDGKGNFVMTKRSPKCRDEHGTWCFPGGGLEFGERVEEALRREVKEEYDAEILKIEFLGMRDVHREHHGAETHWVMLDYKVLVDPAKVRNAEPDMAEAVDWFTLNAFPTPLHSQLRTFVQKYEAKLRE